MLTGHDKINYQAQERKLTKQFKAHLLSPAEYAMALTKLNKPYLKKLRD